jgi:hypothetical protein
MAILVGAGSPVSLGSAAPLDAGEAAGNVVQLDAQGKLPAIDGSQLTGLSFSVSGDLVYKGTFNATTGNKTAGGDLSDAVKGEFYKISAAGTYQGIEFAVNDALIVNADMGGTISANKIDKIDNTESTDSQFAQIELGHASDTTLTRASAGDINVEGNIVYRAGGTDVPVTDGGTGASNASGARTNLGLAIGTDVQAYDAKLSDISGLTQADGAFVVSDGTTFTFETLGDARTSLGLGSAATSDTGDFLPATTSIRDLSDVASAALIDGKILKVVSGTLTQVDETDTNTQRTNAEIQAVVGGMVSGNDETGITVTAPGDGTLDFEVDNTTVAFLGGTQTLTGDKTFTGAVDLTGATATAATQSSGDNSTKVATTAYVDAANVASATKLENSRTIAGQAFDGTADITIGLNDLTGVDTTGQANGKILKHNGTNWIAGDSDTATNADNVIVVANNSTDETTYLTFVDGATGSQSVETDTGLTYNPSTGVLTTTSVSGNLTGNVTGNVSGSAATVTQAAQTAITSVGTLTALTVDDVSIDGNIISSGTGQDLNITPATDQKIVLDGTINVDAGVVTGATSITSTAFVGNITGDLTGDVTGDVTGNLTGNADTSTKLAATKNIAGVAFDGSIDINIPIGNLSDVTISSASDNQVLTYSSGSWINAAASGGDTYLTNAPVQVTSNNETNNNAGRYHTASNTHYIYTTNSAASGNLTHWALPSMSGNSNTASDGDCVLIENASINTVRIYGSSGSTGKTIEETSQYGNQYGALSIDIAPMSSALLRYSPTASGSLGQDGKWLLSWASNAEITCPSSDALSTAYENTALVWDKKSTDIGRFVSQGTTSSTLQIRGDGSDAGTLKVQNAGNTYSTSLVSTSASVDSILKLPPAVGTPGQVLKINAVTGTAATLSWGAVSATDITKTSGNITIDAQGDNTDIIFKGTDGGTDTTFLTLDGSEAGKATFNGDIETAGDIILSGSAKSIQFEDGEVKLTHKDNAGLTVEMTGDGTFQPVLELKSTNDGAGSVLDFLNTNVTFGANVSILKVTSTAGSAVRTQTDVLYNASTGVAKVRNWVHDGSSIVNLLELDGSDSSVDIKGALHLGGVAVTASAAELNLLDGDTAVGGSITIADADGFIVNDNGIMKTIPASTIKTYAIKTYSAVSAASVSGAINYHYSVDSSSNTVNITLPELTTTTAGQEITVKLKTAGNDVTLTAYATGKQDTIDGANTKVISVLNTSLTLVSDGSTNWEIS